MDALIVFARVPEPGRVKTRLAPRLTDAGAARLYEAFLLDALAAYAELGAELLLFLAPSERPLPAAFQRTGVRLFRQEGADLGARMRSAFRSTFRAGASRAVIIGTDHPTLPAGFIRTAFEELAIPRSIVLGPSDDGGYYLLGMNDFYPQLFEGMRYSHAEVLRDTLARAAETDGRLVLLPPWYDVDTPETLDRLAAELRASPAPLPHTRAALRALGID